MDKKKVVDFMFDELENNGEIKLKQDSEYLENLRIENEKSIKLFNYLNKHFYSKKATDILRKLIEDYIDSCRDTTYTANRIYYYQGFIDGIIFSRK